MSNRAARGHRDTALKAWGRVKIGWEGPSCSGPLELRVSKFEPDAGKLTVAELKLVDTVFPTFLFRGPMETTKVKMSVGASTDPNLVKILQHAIDFASGRDDGRFYIIGKTMEELNHRSVRWLEYNGCILTSIPPSAALEGMSADVQLDELEFICETVELKVIDGTPQPQIDDYARNTEPGM